MANKYETALREHIKSTLSYWEEQGSDLKLPRHWLFGAVIFAFVAGLISEETKNALMEEYSLLE